MFSACPSTVPTPMPRWPQSTGGPAKRGAMRSIFSQRMASESPGGGRLPLVSLVPAGAGPLDVPGGDDRVEVADSIAAARGAYVWAVAPGDRLVPGALALVLARLEERDPDVLLVGHDKAGAKLLERVAAAPGPLEAHPRVADTARRPWDKVVRRALLDPAAEPGLVATWRALLAAERIDALPATAYVHEAEGDAVAAADVVAAHEAVLATPDVPPARRKLIAPAAVRHQLALLERAAPAERDALFHRISAFVNAHGGSGERGRVAKVRASLLARDRPRAYRAVGRADRTQRAARRRARRLRTRAAKRLRSERRRRAYQAALKRPIDEHLAVFAAYWYAAYSCNPRAIYEKARELVPGDPRGLGRQARARRERCPRASSTSSPGTPEYYDVIARGEVLRQQRQLPEPRRQARRAPSHVMTHHGTPLKHMGLDLRDNPVTAARRWTSTRCCAAARAGTSASPRTRSRPRSGRRVYPWPYESLETGYPRNDVLATATDEDVARPRARARHRARASAPCSTRPPTASTDRRLRAGARPGRGRGGARPGPRLPRPRALLLRCRRRRPRLDRARRLRDVAAHPSIEELCLAADVLVTDYSSLMFDYAVLDRPIVIHAPDWERLPGAARHLLRPAGRAARAS